MKNFALAVGTVLSTAIIAAPAQAVQFRWNVEYAGFFADDATITGSFIADEAAAADGIVSGDEFSAWTWDWSGNSDLAAFTIDSSNGFFDTSLGPVGFFVDGTPNEVALADGLDQGVYGTDDGETGLDLEFLFVENFAAGGLASGDLTAAAASVTVSAPETVPEPATILGTLSVLFGMATVAKRQRQTA